MEWALKFNMKAESDALHASIKKFVAVARETYVHSFLVLSPQKERIF